MSDSNLDKLADRIHEIGIKKGWDKDWSKGGCYIHLEVSEFIEALRGKGDDLPEEEAADVIITLFAVLRNYNIDPSKVIAITKAKISAMEKQAEEDRIAYFKRRSELLKEISSDPRIHMNSESPRYSEEWTHEELSEWEETWKVW